MCRDGWCLRTAFHLLSDLLEAFDSGEPPRLAFCVRLAEAVQASAALYVRVDTENLEVTCTGWSRAVDVAPLTVVVEHLPIAFPSLFARTTRDDIPSCVSADADQLIWRGSVADLLLWELAGCRDVAQLPLQVSDSEVRLLALFRRRPFTARDMHLLRTVHRPLAALDHVLDPPELEPQHFRVDATDGFPDRVDGGSGDHHLTPREVEVLHMLAEGMLARTIAARMQVSTRTVHKHLGNAYRKLEAHDRLLAVARAQVLGIIPAQRAPRAGADRAPGASPRVVLVPIAPPPRSSYLPKQATGNGGTGTSRRIA